MTGRPNVVVLFPDQLRAQSLPLFGETQIATPHIDRLAGEGTVDPSHFKLSGMHSGQSHAADRAISSNHRSLD